MSPHVINLRFRTYGLVIIINNKTYVLYCIYVFISFSSANYKPGSIASEGLSCLADEG